MCVWASLAAQKVRNLSAMQETWFDPWVWKIPWRRKWLPTPVFLPGEFQGRGNLAGYSPWGHKESDTTEPLTLLCYACVCTSVCVCVCVFISLFVCADMLDHYVKGMLHYGT